MEAVSIFAIAMGPRRGGNSERLLDEFCAGAESIGANVEKVALNDYNISPCTSCAGCAEGGECVIDDDYRFFYLRFFSADRIVIASPVYFMSICAQGKALIDRGQALYIRKYVKKKRIPAREGFPRKGYLISAAGSGLPNSFDCSRTIAKYFYLTMDMEFAGDTCVNRVNDKGDVEKRPDDLKAAFEAGMLAATPA